MDYSEARLQARLQLFESTIECRLKQFEAELRYRAEARFFGTCLVVGSVLMLAIIIWKAR